MYIGFYRRAQHRGIDINLAESTCLFSLGQSIDVYSAISTRSIYWVNVIIVYRPIISNL